MKVTFVQNIIYLHFLYFLLSCLTLALGAQMKELLPHRFSIYIKTPPTNTLHCQCIHFAECFSFSMTLKTGGRLLINSNLQLGGGENCRSEISNLLCAPYLMKIVGEIVQAVAKTSHPNQLCFSFNHWVKNDPSRRRV